MDDPLVEIDMRKLQALVDKTPFTMREFEQIIGWCFVMGDAPASKRRLAWDLLNLPEEDLLYLRAQQKDHPTIWISEVSKCGGSSGAGQ